MNLQEIKAAPAGTQYIKMMDFIFQTLLTLQDNFYSSALQNYLLSPYEKKKCIGVFQKPLSIIRLQKTANIFSSYFFGCTFRLINSSDGQEYV
jgi:hypothetical protein